MTDGPEPRSVLSLRFSTKGRTYSRSHVKPAWRTRIRGSVAIHASKNLTRSEYEESKKRLPRRWRKELPAYKNLPRGVIIGAVELVDCVTESKSPWFEGDYGFVLKNQRPIKPIPCTSASGFWNLPPWIERKIKKLD